MAASTLSPLDAPIPSTLAHQRAAEELRLVCELSASLTVGMLIGGGLLAYAMWTDYSLVTALSWYAVHAAVVIGRLVLHKGFSKRPRTASELTRWTRWVLLGNAAAGFIWSIPTTFFVPTDVVAQLLMGGTILGVAAAAISALSPVRGAYAAFIVPLYVPIVIDRTLDGAHSIIVALGLALFGVLMLRLSARYYHHYSDILRLRFENEALANRLTREKEIAELINRNLQYQVSERERAENGLRAAKAEADAANRAKSQFLANMSHEVRTPLNAILGMTELLRQTPLDAKQTKFAATVHSAGEQLLSILNDILDLSRVEAGRLRLNKVAFEPQVLLREVVDLMSAQASRKSLWLRHCVDADVPTALEGDPDRLRQILVNLVSNAIKFTEHGSVCIHVSLGRSNLRRAMDHHQHVIRWAVTDTGIGIDPHEHARLFKPFSQIDESTTRRFGGTGLGLAICRQLIEAMGGRIDVTSRPGEGSTFWFEVPLRSAAAGHTPEPLSAETACLPRLDARVLIAEDNEVNRTLVIEMLEILGCTTAVATHGGEVLPQLERNQFDLVLMDWHMPELDGLSATRLLRSREIKARNGERLPVIALTASVMAGDREACLAAGADDYLSKPFTHQALVNKLQQWLPTRDAS